MSNLEFTFKLHYCDACILVGGCWGELTLKRVNSPSVLQQVVLPFRRGSTVYGPQLWSSMQQLAAMFMSTARGLSA